MLLICGNGLSLFGAATIRNLLILAIAVAAPVSARDAPAPRLGAAECRSPAAQRAQTNRQAGPMRLGQLPDAKLILAVDYREGGCQKPIVVSRTVR